MLSRCHPEGFPNLPNCDIVEYCTDYSIADNSSSTDTVSSDGSDLIAETESADNTDTDTLTDSDSETTTPTGIVCEYVCEGNLISCDDITDENRCTRADHCEWYDDSID